MNGLLRLLNIQHPIIQAPMAGGVTTTALVSEVSNAGGLGNIGAGYMSVADIRTQIREVKVQASKPYGINLFVPEERVVQEQFVEDVFHYMKPFRDKLQIEEEPIFEYVSNYEEQVEVVLEEGVPVCSFTFGLPSKEVVQKLQRSGTVVIGTATTVNEAIQIEELGMDAVVVQGSEAGGHRGHFDKVTEQSLIGLMSLVPQVVDQVNLPVIAAGGIMDGRGVSAAICLGAQAVQMGTAFLTCVESGAHELHKKAILEADEADTVLTKVFSGKHARGIKNTFISEMNEYKAELPPYPIQNALTKGIRKEAGKQNNAEFLSLWSGQSPRLSRTLSAGKLVERVMSEVYAILK